MERMRDLEEVKYSKTSKKMTVSSVRFRTGPGDLKLNSVKKASEFA
jgi:hypothetical protein